MSKTCKDNMQVKLTLLICNQLQGNKTNTTQLAVIVVQKLKRARVKKSESSRND